MTLKYLYNTEKESTKIISQGLGDFNNSITGEIECGGESFYLINDGLLLGSIQASFFWDILAIKNVSYQNLEVLTVLVDLIFNKFKDKIGSFVYSTINKQQVRDLKELGFNTYGEILNKPKDKILYELVNYTYTPKNIKHNNEIFTKKNIDKKYKEFSDDKIEEKEEILQFIAKDGDLIVGGIYGILKDNYGDIDMLWVHKKYRNRKVATNLIEKFENKSLEKGYNNFILGTAEFQAKGLYEKCGYKVISELKNCPNGYKNYSMVKVL